MGIDHLQNVRQKLVGKSDQGIASIMDKNGDGDLTKEKVKQGLVDLTEVELEEISNAEIDLLWDRLVGSTGVIDLRDDDVSDRWSWGSVFNTVVKYGVPIASAAWKAHRG